LTEPEPAPQQPRRRFKILGTLASVTLFAVSLVVLGLILRDLNVAEVKAAFAATSRTQLLFAFLCTILSYLMLTGYDALGLRQLRLTVPYRITALASFSSYSVSFTLGFPLITAGTVRYWIYSAHGLGARAIASLTVIAGVTFWLGMGIVLGLCLILRPAAVSELNRLPVSLNQLIGGAILTAVALYLAWVAQKQRAITVQGWTLWLPSLRVSLGQMALGAADVCAAAGVLYVLLPQGYGIAFESFLAVYVFACILGIASHAPGGIGVFEATILLALPGIPREALLGSLVMFRLIYYLLPFVLALLLLAGREIVVRSRALRRDVDRDPVVMESRDEPQARAAPADAGRATERQR
jgi:hypothetical protein